MDSITHCYIQMIIYCASV